MRWPWARKSPQEDPGALVSPLSVDPDNMPHYRVYSPQTGRQPPVCTCHQEPLPAGTQVLWWPMPDSEEVRLFCSRTTKGLT